MRLIDADALEELFRETIGGIAKKPEISGNLEHMVRASAMVICMIKDAPTIEPERSSDCISRQAAIDAVHKSHDTIFRENHEFVTVGYVERTLLAVPSAEPEITRAQMTRNEFMDLVYDELSNDSDNYRANRIIDAADEYANEAERKKGKWVDVTRQKTMAQAFLEVAPGCYKRYCHGIEYPDICLERLLSGDIKCVSQPDGSLDCAKCWQRPYNGEFEKEEK